MRVCLVRPPLADAPGRRAVERLAKLLGGHHEVVVVDGYAGPDPDCARISFAAPEHRWAAAVLDAIRAAYGGRGPDYLEIPDSGPHGLVALQARQTGDPLLERTLIGVRISPSSELRAVHDADLGLPGPTRAAELEREQLRLADRLIWPGGDTLDLYRRYYADLRLPEAVRIPSAFEREGAAPPAAARDPEAPLRLLFAGALDRHRGALDLVDACLRLAEGEWRLTMTGADRRTAAMGQSARATIEAMAGEDPRIEVLDEVPLEELRRRFADHDLMVVPARVAAWEEVAVEATLAGLPVLATPVGGLVEIVEPGVNGWHADQIGAEALRRALAAVLADRGELERMRGSAALAARARRLADPEPILAGYRQLAAASAPAPAIAVREPERVSGIVPHFGTAEFVGDAVASLLGQSHPLLEVLVVNDGSFHPEDSVLGDLAEDPRVRVVTQINRGEAAARDLGATLARGEYLAMLDADNVLEPGFVEHALRAFRRDPDLAYVTCWLRMVDVSGVPLEQGHGYAPLGNAVVVEDSENWDGDAIALLPRRLFSELGFGYGQESSLHDDWEFYRWLRSAGHLGAVMPELLARYRVRPGSLLRSHSKPGFEAAWAESRIRSRGRGMRWIAAGRDE